MKRTLLTIAAVAALVALCAGTAFAEGYNDADGAGAGVEGIYVRDAGAGQIESFSGPHGGYTTTTNKCQDCHSTHYAFGSYKLLRADSAEAACDFCHGGGGGSDTNIMMDNAYKTDFDASTDFSGVVDTVNTPAGGYGTGHTLGYTGKAPADIEPAFQDAENGLACFSCHTPHGNSARVLQSFGSPARPAGDGEVSMLYGVPFIFAQFYQMQEMYNVRFDGGALFSPGMASPTGAGYAIPYDFRTIDLGDVFGPTQAGISPFLKTGGAPREIGAIINDPAVDTRPDLAGVQNMGPLSDSGSELGVAMAAMGAWQADGAPGMPDMSGIGAFFTAVGVPQADGTLFIDAPSMGMMMGMFPGTLADLMMKWNVYYGEDVKAGNVATAFLNMGDYQAQGGGVYAPIAMPELEVWHKPLFFKGRYLLLQNPDSADDQGGLDYVQQMDGSQSAPVGKKVAINWKFPIGPAASWGPFFSTDSNERFPIQFPWAPTGVAMENEMCTSCHDGSAGMSTQAATVWMPNPTDALDGTYITAYSHDENSRGCARAQYINTDDDNNFGPHCANCHSGGSGCQTCHSAEGDNWETFGEVAYTTDPVLSAREGVTTFEAPASVRTQAVASISGKCLDGGFSYPHRTLGANMLKDSIWGVDFDGTEVAAGDPRSYNGALLTAAAADLTDFYSGGASFDADTIVGTNAIAENLDSVCIDCHGDATYWAGDASDEVTFTSTNPLMTSQSWDVAGWNLLLKGLP
ncbi:MAG: hypothetical protein CVT67_07120 [Actinobacteria bacterium HGW-Actinobacteria-7]|jgi:hypothetical protein|nr:MAG: hypothetical protein CVT67_07120 [Actinobacteria bacterium HGW-Actinobacteria-7]